MVAVPTVRELDSVAAFVTVRVSVNVPPIWYQEVRSVNRVRLAPGRRARVAAVVASLLKIVSAPFAATVHDVVIPLLIIV